MKKSVNYIFCKEKKAWSGMDAEVAEVLGSMGERIEASEELKGRIDDRIRTLVKEERSMNRFSMKKVAAGVAAACLLAGTVCVAGNGIMSYVGSTSVKADYQSFADMAKAEEKVGYQVDAVERFSNGFVLDDGIHISNYTVENQAGEKVERQKGISLEYKKGSDDIFFRVRKLYSGESEAQLSDRSTWDKVVQEDGIDFYYSQSIYKLVPDDYEITEAEQTDIESGKLQIAYDGRQGQDAEVQQSYYVGWIKDGKVYTLSGFDLSISADEMLGMAKEVAESGN